MTNKIRLGHYLHSFMIIGDFAIVNLAYWLVCMLFDSSPEFRSKLVFLVVNAAFVPSAVFFSDVHKKRILFADRVVLQVCKSMLMYAAILLALFYELDIFDLGWHCGRVFYGSVCILMTIWWLSAHALLKKIRRMGLNFRRVALVGSNDSAYMLLHQLQGDSGYGYRIMGIFDDNPVTLKRFSDHYCNKVETLRDFVRINNIDTIFYTLAGDDQSPMRSVMEVADEMGIEFVYLPNISPSLRGHFVPSHVGTMPALTHTVSPLNKPKNSLLKRAFDICFSLPIVLLSPIWVLPIAILIKLSSRGPIFFKQKRTGIRGKDFTCLKFRTMKVNKDADKLQATENDPRKTRVGDFLRRSSLDELPQFFNVLAGQMSVVGPRPHMVSQTIDYTALINKYMVRHAIKPGITGWAQVNGYRGGTQHLWQMERRVEFDVWYIHHWNFFLDLKIILLTIINALRHEKNAY